MHVSCMHAYVCICMYACAYTCMYVCVYACMLWRCAQERGGWSTARHESYPACMHIHTQSYACTHRHMAHARTCARACAHTHAHACMHTGGWSTARHESYPTTDIPVQELPETLRWVYMYMYMYMYTDIPVQELPETLRWV